jgi:hypothetical protein
MRARKRDPGLVMDGIAACFFFKKPYHNANAHGRSLVCIGDNASYPTNLGS